jgi:alpha-L-fucosidase
MLSRVPSAKTPLQPFRYPVNTDKPNLAVAEAPGIFQPNWESLAHYRCPDWFRDAKFGIWAHWGPQCQPEAGDWYARHMYVEGHGQHKSHLARYGNPSEFGFKDVIHAWKADRWDPDKLVAFYKQCGAKYFFAMANHHDNFDLWDSRHQSWNSVAIGPRKNIIAGWAAAARKQGLRFGVSVHSAHAWSWMEPAQDFDGKLTKAEGKGTWWEGLDPQDLYAQNHPRSAGGENPGTIHSQWEWGNGASVPDEAYCRNFLDRTKDLVDRYKPDLVYFDDTVLPLWPISNVGLEFTAHYYSTVPGSVVFGKILDEQQRKCLVWDIERGVPATAFPFPWQTCTCIGGWHYNRDDYERNLYKSAKTVIHMLADVVSKNGNLLLSVPVRADGTIDEKEEKIVGEIGDWLRVHGEAIYETRPWHVFGEGPASAGAELSHQGFNEGRGKPFTAGDVRFTRFNHPCIPDHPRGAGHHQGQPRQGSVEVRFCRAGGRWTVPAHLPSWAVRSRWLKRNPNENLWPWRGDMIAVYNLARMWYFTGNEAYAQKARDILIAWATTHKTFGGNESGLDLGDYAVCYGGGASILRGTWPGWTQQDTITVQNYFRNVLWPATAAPYKISGPANKGSLNVAAGAAIAVFCDDTNMFNHVIDVFRSYPGAGLPNILATGQMGETGRDIGHGFNDLSPAPHRRNLLEAGH